MVEFISLVEQYKKQVSNPKVRLALFLLSLGLFYLFGFFILLNPLQMKTELLLTQINTLRSQLATSQQQINEINQAVKSRPLVQAFTEQQNLSSKIKELEQGLLKATPVLISEDEWLKVKKAIISQQNDIDSKITLISIRDLPQRKVDEADFINKNKSDIYQNILEVEFQADYFSVIEYLSRLEKLPWHLYWDSLAYKVLAYPKADVTIQFHVFTDQQDTL